jgi:hypothetical protein
MFSKLSKLIFKYKPYTLFGYLLIGSFGCNGDFKIITESSEISHFKAIQALEFPPEEITGPADIIEIQTGLTLYGFFQSPIREFEITSGFGVRQDPTKKNTGGKRDTKFHAGLDLAPLLVKKENLNIRALNPGYLCFIPGNDSLGNHFVGVPYDLSTGLTYLLAHTGEFPSLEFLAKDSVSLDELYPLLTSKAIYKGSNTCREITLKDKDLIIGRASNSGNATGVHVHTIFASCSTNANLSNLVSQKMKYTNCPIFDGEGFIEAWREFRYKQ